MNDHPKIGLALGSGGARGLAHIGVIKALVESEIEISYISGSSMGALVGAVYAATRSAEELEEVARKFSWRSMLRLFLPSLSRAGLVNGDNVMELLRENLTVRDFSELKIPLALETTDLETGDLITIKEGDLLRAIRASISIPLIFSPIEINGHILVDGGLVSPVPVRTVREMGADYVIAVNVLEKTRTWARQEKVEKRLREAEQSGGLSLSQILRRDRTEDKPSRTPEKDLGFMMVLAQTVGIAISKMASYQLQLERPELLITPDTTQISVYDFHRGDEIIDTAYGQALEDFRKMEPSLR